MPSYTGLLSEDEWGRANRFMFKRDRDRFIAARGELRRMLGERTDTPPEDIEFRYGAHGKPELQAGLSKDDLRFNVSHSQDVAIFAFAHGRRVGIDIEAIRPMPDADEVAARCFSPLELETYRALSSSERLTGFFNGWTRKEALVKALGLGLSYSLKDFDVTLDPAEPARIRRIGELSGEECGWALYATNPVPGFAAALVMESSTR